MNRNSQPQAVFLDRDGVINGYRVIDNKPYPPRSVDEFVILPGVVEACRKLKQAVFVGEIFVDRLYKLPLRQPAVEELSKFQPVRRDFSLLFPDTVAYAAIENALAALAIPELRGFAPKEILREAKSIPAGHFSLLLRTVFQSQERTLREEELQVFSQKTIAALEVLGGRLRC